MNLPLQLVDKNRLLIQMSHQPIPRRSVEVTVQGIGICSSDKRECISHSRGICTQQVIPFEYCTHTSSQIPKQSWSLQSLSWIMILNKGTTLTHKFSLFVPIVANRIKEQYAGHSYCYGHVRMDVVKHEIWESIEDFGLHTTICHTKWFLNLSICCSLTSNSYSESFTS